MGHIPTLQSLIAGRWHGAASHTPLHSALDSTLIYHTHAEKIDFDEAADLRAQDGRPGADGARLPEARRQR